MFSGDRLNAYAMYSSIGLKHDRVGSEEIQEHKNNRRSFNVHRNFKG